MYSFLKGKPINVVSNRGYTNTPPDRLCGRGGTSLGASIIDQVLIYIIYISREVVIFKLIMIGLCFDGTPPMSTICFDAFYNGFARFGG